MELTKDILCKVEVPTANLKVETIQDLLLLVKDNSKKSEICKEFWEAIAKKLWRHLANCLENLDDQLLCVTCFYSVVNLADKQDYYLEKLLHIVSSETTSPSNHIRSSLPASKRLPSRVRELSLNVDNLEQSTSTLRVVSLIYGMFQSSFLLQILPENMPKMAAILKEIFDLILPLGYEYSEYTFLVFKIIKSFKKVCGGTLEKYLFNNENNEKLLALVTNNWENPVTGVRDLNRSIFQTILSTLDDDTYRQVLEKIEELYWNKAKFLMLSEIIETYPESIMVLIKHNWIAGLIYSLHKPGLVSAGADMYYALLKRINTQDDWCQLFLFNLINIFNGDSIKAIENFCNYWCLTTIKKFKTITYVLLDELEKQAESEHILFSKLSIIKQANKLGIIDKKWNIPTEKSPVQNAVLMGIDHCSSLMRILAFDIVCVSQGKSIPSLLEYNLILDYVYNNVNSDSTVLRLSLFSSLNYFMTQLHFTFINVILKTETSEDIKNLEHFCNRLQSFVMNNIILNGNYQRKITTIKLCNSVLTNFSEIPKKRKDQTRHANITLIGYLKQNKFWLLSKHDFVKEIICLLKDPADDVRENVVKILLTHYTYELQDGTLLSDLIADAKICMQSKFFYEISCGQSMFKLITHLLIKEKQSIAVEFKSVEDIFDFAYKELITQHAETTNVMNSIEKGKQLHSFMNILLVVLEECILSSHKICIPNCKMSCLLKVLESVLDQFAWEEKGSSDFSKMNDMVQNIIATSDYKPIDEDDQTKISGLQQIVLNCLWLNVKASCDLASVLIQYNVDDINMCNKCLNIITRVLETSRHKGAIEAAGAALGRGIQYLTSLPVRAINISENALSSILCLEKSEVSRLPYNLLKTKLKDLISETNKMSSITRRGAGLSIMVHRMVSSDMKKGKPLFHYFIKTLLQACRQSTNTENHTPIIFAKGLEELGIDQQSNVEDDTTDNQVDLPRAIYIHFLTRIVTDSSLSTHVMYYAVELAELAFGNLTDSHWQIRNAALQLYGALIPRLIGQKKVSGTDEETIATVTCDEVRTHLPKLWRYIICQLKESNDHDIIQDHSNLVPILNLLANSAKRYYFILHTTEEETEFSDLFYHLLLYLNSPIYTVRRLTAKTIFNLYELEYIRDGILKQENITENLLHGMLLLLNLCHKSYSSNSAYNKTFIDLKNKFDTILSTGKHSYLCKKIYEDIYINFIDMKDVENTILELRDNVSPGVQVWAEARLQKYVNKCSCLDIPDILKVLLQQSDYEKYCTLIKFKIESESSIPTHVLLEAADILIAVEKRYCSSSIWQMLYEISTKTNLHRYIDAEQLMDSLGANISYNLRYILPLIARYIEKASSVHKFNLINIISRLSDFENSDASMRYISALANNELAHHFNKLTDSQKIISIKCAVLLLQDEDEDVRNITVKFYSNVCGDKREFQPYICLNKILNKCFLYTAFHEPQKSIEELRTKLNDKIKMDHVIDEYNPFANDSKNVYFEPHVAKHFIDNMDV